MNQERPRTAARRPPGTASAAIAIFLFSLASSPAGAQVDPTLEAGIDSIFSEWNRSDSPGVGVGVVQGRRLVFARGYGLADLEHRVPITPRTPFHVASEAKQFTAVAVLLLAERGVLSLDDDVRAWVPEVPDFGRTITLRHLLNHTSGLRDQWQGLALAGRYGDDAITTGDVLRMVERQRELNFEPGEMELYCNTGFTLLAEAVARATGRSFRDFTREEIFEPLEMASTRFHDDLRELVPGRARSYGRDRETGAFERRILNYAVPGATSLFTTVEDMARWLAELGEPAIRRTALYGPLYARDTLNDGREVVWGFGMNVGEHRGWLRLGHGGGDAGFRAWSVRFPEHDLGVIVLANVAEANPGPFGDALALQVADLFLPPEGGVPEGAEAASEAEREAPLEPDLDAFVGSYETPDGGVVNVTDEFGVLHIWEPGAGEELPLDRVGPSDFVPPGDSVGRVSFDLEGDRAVRMRASAVRSAGPSGSYEAARVDPVPSEGLETYAGAYRSAEFQTVWTLAVDEGVLVARHLMHGDVPLAPRVRDLFDADAWFLGEVRFTRNAQGVVDGFRLDAGRIKNVRFERGPGGR